MKYLRNEPLNKHSSFRIGGPADYFCVPRTVEDIQAALRFARENEMQAAVLGAGSNLLVLDEGVRGLVIKLGRGLNWIKVSDGKVQVGSGVLLPRLIKTLAGYGLGGLEFLAGVPGSVGGAVVMNAGAWGKEISRYVEEVRALDRAGREKTFKKRQLGFGYRQCLLKGSRWIVTEIVFKLRKSKKKLIKKRIREFLLKRKSSQPLGIPNCGSVFKNPRGDFAGRLIEEAGCKGMRMGDAQVSVKHGNFIVNLGEARSADVIKLVTIMQRSVRDKFKILLEPEIEIMVKSPS